MLVGQTIIKWTAVKATCVFVDDVVYVSSYVLVAFNAFVHSLFDYSRGIPCVLPRAMDLQRTLASESSRASLVRRRRGSNDDTKGWSIGFEVAEKFDSNGG